MQQDEEGAGGHDERVAQIEKEFGPYVMISDLFDYNALIKNTNFTILPFRDALYRGQLLEGDRREGVGVMMYESGRVYEGEWLNDKRHGMGFEKYKNGNEYKGQFERGKANGQGKYIWMNTGEVYEGGWLNGYKHGFGHWKSKTFFYNWFQIVTASPMWAIGVRIKPMVKVSTFGQIQTSTQVTGSIS